MSRPESESRFTHGARALFASISLRLFLALTAVILVAFFVFTWVSLRSASRQYEHALYEGAVRFSDLIEQSTQYGMLLNRKEEVHHVIEAIAEAPDVEGVRIYDKNGRIMFSADSTETNRSVPDPSRQVRRPFSFTCLRSPMRVTGAAAAERRGAVGESTGSSCAKGV